MSKTSIQDVIEAVAAVRDLRIVVAVQDEVIEQIVQRLDAIEQRLDAPPKRRR